jgi:hypothetical protein
MLAAAARSRISDSSYGLRRLKRSVRDVDIHVPSMID